MSELDLRDRIRDVPDFPSEGIIFKDLMPLIADPEYFAETIRRLADWARPREPALIFGAEARGFIFGAALAYALGAGFIAARKPGKLPRETVEATYALEYVEGLGGIVAGVLFVIELDFLKGRERLAGYDVHSLIQY
jgi:adenine phosphoribosyltransferase